MSPEKARVPPRWFVKLAWKTHRGIYRITRGKVGLSRPKPGKWGTMRVTTVGRRSGEDRSVMLGYFVDGENLVTMAMNGWSDGQPAWWLNLEATPEAEVETAGAPRRPVRARAAEGEERDRLWARWQEIDDNLDEYAQRRSVGTPVVVLEPIGG